MVTIKEIAKAVGVSSATVSRVLNFDSTLSITEPKRQAIIETAEALNYSTPRERNRTNRHKVKNVGLVHFLQPEEELGDPYYVSLRLGIERRCQKLNIEVAKFYPSMQSLDANTLKGLGGVIVVGWHNDETISMIAEHARHVVMADFAPDDDQLDSVFCDLSLATQKLLGALQQAGHKRIGFIGWEDIHHGVHHGGMERRLETYRKWMRDRNMLDESICLTEDNSEQSGYRLTLRLLDAPTRPDAIIACNDNMAVGAYRALSERGVKIPGDIAVASFNDISVAQFLTPPLTTVRLPAEQIGETAVDLMLERVAGRKISKRVTLATSLKWRASTKLPQK